MPTHASKLTAMLNRLNAALVKKDNEYYPIKNRKQIVRIDFHYVRFCCIVLQEQIKALEKNPVLPENILKKYQSDTELLLKYIDDMPCLSHKPNSAGFLLKVPSNGE